MSAKRKKADKHSSKRARQADAPDVAVHDDEQPHAGADVPMHVDVEGETIELPPAVASLIHDLQRERDEAVDGRLRALADFKNFQRRSAENESRASTDGTIRVIRALLPVLDHVDLALQQDVKQLSVEQLLGGVKLLQQEFARALETFGLQPIRPEIGDEFDANAHEAMMRQPSEDVPPNHVTMVMQPGFRLGDVMLRPAKVAVAAEPANTCKDQD